MLRSAGASPFSSGLHYLPVRLRGWCDTYELTGDGWLDPSTVRLTYTLVNNDGTSTRVLRPISGPWCFFRRARCLVGGAIVDDVDYYNRVHDMLHILTSKANRETMTLKLWRKMGLR